MNKERGLTLVELLVAFALSATLITALFKIVDSTQQGVRLSSEFAKTQDAARTAFGMLQYDLRMAGYLGCAISGDDGKLPINLLLDQSSPSYNPAIHEFVSEVEGGLKANTIDGFSVLTRNNILAVLKQANDGQDISVRGDLLISRRAIPADLQVSAIFEDAIANEIKLEFKGPDLQLEQLEEGQLMLLSNCKKTDLFVLSAVDDGKATISMGETNNGLRNEFGSGCVKDSVLCSQNLSDPEPEFSQVLLLNTSVFFVAPSQALSDEEIYSLYRYDSMSGKIREMIPYIYNMEFKLYVDDTATSSEDYGDGVPDSWFPTSWAEDKNDLAERIHAVRVNLELKTEQTCSEDNTAVSRCLEKQEYERVIHFRNSGRREQ